MPRAYNNPYSNEEIDAARKRALRYMGKNKMSQTRLANKIGISASSFSLWLKDQYTGDVNKTTEKVLDFLKLENERDKTPSDFDFIETSVAKQVRDALTYSEMLRRIVMITSPPGDGKTMALRHYVNPHRSVFITARSTLVINSFVHEITDELISQALGVKNTDQILRRIADVLKARPKTIVIDEAQHLNSKSLDALRYIHDESQAPIFLSGNDELLETIRTAPRMQQLGSRLHHFRVQRISFEDAKNLISQRFPAMKDTQMKTLYSHCRSTRGLCDMVLALDLFCRNQNIPEPTPELTEMVKKIKVTV